MNKEFLNKILVQLVNETIMDYKKERISPPFSLPFYLPSWSPSFSFSRVFSLFPVSFSRHCKNLYALNEQEIKYVWEEYKNTIHKMFDKELA